MWSFAITTQFVHLPKLILLFIKNKRSSLMLVQKKKSSCFWILFPLRLCFFLFSSLIKQLFGSFPRILLEPRKKKSWFIKIKSVLFVSHIGIFLPPVLFWKSRFGYKHQLKNNNTQATQFTSNFYTSAEFKPIKLEAISFI